MTQPGLDHAREVADALLFEGYLLYPYRASSSKNQVRWQFGVLGPPGAAEAGIGEESTMSVDCLLSEATAGLTIHVRFLQLQSRTAEIAHEGGFRPVAELVVGASRWLTWDEAVQVEQELGPLELRDLWTPTTLVVSIPGGRDIELLPDPNLREGAAGRLVRERRALNAELTLQATRIDGCTRLSIAMSNTAPPAGDKTEAVAVSFIGAHLLLQVDRGEFVSIVNPPDHAMAAAAGCRRQRWWPILAGPADESRVLLVSPIIVEDHAELAPESAGALFDSTEIDEILTLRVMTMTDAEKADARATDPRAAEIIDRCDAMSPEELQGLHGALRNPHGGDQWLEADVPWWDPEADADVAPGTDVVRIAGVSVSKGSLVVVRPTRRADAQDIFFAGKVGKVAAVLSDVDGDTHVAVTLVDDPAADLHEWYGRYLYFAPDELEPLPAGVERTHIREGEAP